jgi:hypothetical protein
MLPGVLYELIDCYEHTDWYEFIGCSIQNSNLIPARELVPARDD